HKENLKRVGGRLGNRGKPLEIDSKGNLPDLCRRLPHLDKRLPDKLRRHRDRVGLSIFGLFPADDTRIDGRRFDPPAAILLGQYLILVADVRGASVAYILPSAFLHHFARDEAGAREGHKRVAVRNSSRDPAIKCLDPCIIQEPRERLRQLDALANQKHLRRMNEGKGLNHLPWNWLPPKAGPGKGRVNPLKLALGM